MIRSDISPTLNDFYPSGGPIDTDDAQIGMDWDVLQFDTSDMLVGSSKNNTSEIREDTAFAGLDANFNPDHLSLTTLPWSAWIRAPIADPVSNFTTNIIMQMLCAFPQMMLRRETLPPFIHGHWYRASTAAEPALPKPLVNCTGIAQVFASQNPECKPFLWNSIKTELHVSNTKVISPLLLL